VAGVAFQRAGSSRDEQELIPTAFRAQTPGCMVRITRSMLRSYSRRQRRNLRRCMARQISTATSNSRIISSVRRLCIAVPGQLTNAMDKEITTHNATITNAALSWNASLGRRNQNQMTRESSESPVSNKSTLISGDNRKGGNSSYFQAGSVVRSFHILKSPSFRSAAFFTASPLVPAHSRLPPRRWRRLGQSDRQCLVSRQSRRCRGSDDQ
jgi:hypothetical protein